jgi:hypothetical protein
VRYQPYSHFACAATLRAAPIKITSMRTWTDWTQVVGPGLMKAREEALSVSDSKAPIGSAYNRAMGALLQEYGFGDALERKRSEVTRADLLHCMDHLNEIKTWLRRYPDQTVLNHPSVVWRRFKASEDGKRLLNARDGDVPAKPPGPSLTWPRWTRRRSSRPPRKQSMRQ